jgi:hypothetical protein
MTTTQDFTVGQTIRHRNGISPRYMGTVIAVAGHMVTVKWTVSGNTRDVPADHIRTAQPKQTEKGTEMTAQTTRCTCPNTTSEPYTFGPRCERHTKILGRVYENWGDPVVGPFLVAQADGYGERGFAPDWSAFRDSSVEAIDRMGAILLDGLHAATPSAPMHAPGDYPQMLCCGGTMANGLR